MEIKMMRRKKESTVMFESFHCNLFKKPEAIYVKNFSEILWNPLIGRNRGILKTKNMDY